MSNLKYKLTRPHEEVDENGRGHWQPGYYIEVCPYCGKAMPTSRTDPPRYHCGRKQCEEMYERNENRR